LRTVDGLSYIQGAGLQPVADERKLELIIVNHEDFCLSAAGQRHDAGYNRTAVKAITLMTVSHVVSSQDSPCCSTQTCCGTRIRTQII
jgi:hypothetical protein